MTRRKLPFAYPFGLSVRLRLDSAMPPTMTANALRGHLAEFGIVAARGLGKVSDLMSIVEHGDGRLPECARSALMEIVGQLSNLDGRIHNLEAEISRRHRSDEMSQLLTSVPGIGTLTASAITATVVDPSVFRSGREFAAWVGLVPRQYSTGGKSSLGGISKAGNQYLRRLLVIGATAVLRHIRRHPTPDHRWALQLLERKPPKLAAVALANKMARVIWAMLSHGEQFRPGYGTKVTVAGSA